MAENFLEKFPGETDSEYHSRLIRGKMVDRSLADVDYSELSLPLYGKQYSSEATRKMMYGSKLTMDALMGTQQTAVHGSSDVDRRIYDLQEERRKLQAEKVEYNRMLRETSRDDLLIEKFADAIKTLEPLDIPTPMPTVFADREGVLCFGDEHFGSEFTIRGLGGEIINEYSIEIAKGRMESLLSRVIAIVRKEGISTLHVYNMGDFTDGVLRVGQLRKLELGVVDSTVVYMEYISNWLNELSKYVHVKFQMVHGNHSELRMLGQQKGSFKDENMGKIVSAYIRMRLADNPNFEYAENPSGLIFDSVLGYNILGIHGEVKNMSRALRDFSFMYGVNIDYIIGGHLHHLATESDGNHKQAIRVPSIVGTDEYSMSLHKISDPGAVLFIVEQNLGKNIEYTIYL